MDSPEMKFARHRLGNLLQGIRHNGSYDGNLKETDQSLEEEQSDTDEDYVGPESAEEQDGLSVPGFASSFGGASPVKRSLSFDTRETRSSPNWGKKVKRKEKKVLFELRGKPFELRDKQREESLFSLCRTWVKGKEAPDIKEELPDPFANEASDSNLEMLASKEIHSLPKPKPEDSDVSKFPEYFPMEHKEEEEVDRESREELLASYLPHWKDVKKRWVNHNRHKEGRYTRSLILLETVYNLAQQNQMISDS